MLLGIAVTRRDESHVVMAFLTLSVLVGSGTVGGLTYYATTTFRERGAGWTFCAWALTALAALIVAAVLGRALIPPFERIAPEAERLELLTSFPAVWALAIAAILLAFQVTNVLGASRSGSSARASGEPELGRLLTWAMLVTILSAGVRVLNEPSRLRLPESAAEARTVLERAEAHARLLPEDAHAQLALGLALLELERFSEAESHLRRAAQLAPDSTHALNALGWMLNRQERFTESVEPLREAIRLQPDYGNAHHNLGWAWIQLGRLEDAEAAYAEAVRHLPRNGWAAMEYSWVLQTRGKAEPALRYALRAATLMPDDYRAHVAAASLLQDLGRLAEAESHLDAALRVNRKSPTVWAQLGVTRFTLGDMAGAAKAFAEAERLSPSFFDEGSLEHRMWEAARRDMTRGAVDSLSNPRRQVGDTGIK